MDNIISSHPFEYYLEQHTNYIKSVVYSAHRRNFNLTPEDTYQELLIVAWNCYKKYADKSIGDYIKLLKRSICNRLATIARTIKKKSMAHLEEFPENYIKIAPGPTPESFYELIEETEEKLKEHKYATKNVKEKISEQLKDTIY